MSDDRVCNIALTQMPRHQHFFGDIELEAEKRGTGTNPVTVGPVHLSTTPITELHWDFFEMSTGYRRQMKGFEIWDWGWKKPRPSDLELRLPNQPAVGVTYADSLAFCSWLSEVCDIDARLPSEIEFECAAKAKCSCALFCAAAKASAGYVRSYGEPALRTSPLVMQRSSNNFGFHDMNGLIWQWCSDPVMDDGTIPTTLTRLGTPEQSVWRGKAVENARIIRGGSFAYPIAFSRCAQRSISAESDSNFNLGFRIAVTAREDDETLGAAGIKVRL